MAGLAALVAETDKKILAASGLGAAACVFVIVVSTRHFLRQSWLWPTVQPVLKETGRQLLRFAVIFLVVAGPWHVGIFVKQGHGYVTDFLIKHNVHRAGETVNRSGVSEFYMRVLIFGYYPWSCFLPVALAGVVGWWDRNPLKRYALEIFLLIAAVVTFTAFTGSATKFAHYLAPIMVPVAVLIGLLISRTLDERHAIPSRLAWIAASMLFLLPTLDLLDSGGMMYLVGSFTMKRWVPPTGDPGLYLKGLMIAVGACLFASILWRSRVLVAALIAAAALLANYNTAHFIPELSRNKTMKHLCETWKEHAPDGDPPICLFADIKHGVFFYTENRIKNVRSRQDFERFIDPARPAFCIVQREALPNLQRNHRVKHDGAELYLANDSHFRYVLISNTKLPEDKP